jgi:hypothetical protein
MAQKKCGCPVINDADYEGKVFNWEGRAFFVSQVRYFFGVPIGVEEKMAEAARIIEQKEFILEEPPMILAREGRFDGAIYVAIMPPEEQHPSVVVAPPCAVAATVVTRKEAKVVADIKAFKKRLVAQGKNVRNVYLWHVSCPQCVKTDGYKTVLFAELGL